MADILPVCPLRQSFEWSTLNSFNCGLDSIPPRSMDACHYISKLCSLSSGGEKKRDGKIEREERWRNLLCFLLVRPFLFCCLLYFLNSRLSERIELRISTFYELLLLLLPLVASFCCHLVENIDPFSPVPMWAFPSSPLRSTSLWGNNSSSGMAVDIKRGKKETLFVLFIAIYSHSSLPMMYITWIGWAVVANEYIYIYICVCVSGEKKICTIRSEGVY